MTEAVLPPPGGAEETERLLQAVDGPVVAPPPHQGAELSVAVLPREVEPRRRGKAPHVAGRRVRPGGGGRLTAWVRLGGEAGGLGRLEGGEGYRV